MTTSLYWYKLVFMAEILLAEGLFTYKLKKRRYFALRIIASIAACAGIAMAYPVLLFNAWYASIMFISLFLFSMLCIKFCYNESWINVFFCSMLSYTVQHLAFVFYNLIVVSFDLVEAGALGTYLDHATTDYNAYTTIAYFACYYITYWLSYLFCGTKIKKNEDLNIGSLSLVMLSAAILFVVVIFNAVIAYYSADNYDKTYSVIFYSGGIISCILVLVIQINLFDKKRLKREVDTMQLLMHQEQEQYSLSKENIELINIKCHDLKHRIANFRGRLDDKEIEEMENAVMIYDSIVKTGNEVLDVILTEKSLKCKNNDILLTCTVDDSDLSFISVADLYSLFGNIIENAIEAVLKVEKEDKRIIYLNIKSTENLLSVHVENYFSGSLTFVDGLPETTKTDKRFHGFGLKSIKMIAEKYGGNLIARASGDIFKINILFPRAGAADSQ